MLRGVNKAEVNVDGFSSRYPKILLAAVAETMIMAEKQRFLCRNDSCGKTFIQEYSDKGRLPEIKQRLVDMAVNGSGIRDTVRVLNISTDTVINELKKR